MNDLFPELEPPKVTRLLVCGGRKFRDVQLLWNVLGQYLKPQMPPLEVLIEGEAQGADKLAADWARIKGVPLMPFPGGDDPIARNQTMLNLGRPTTVLAFPGGNGTKNMVRISIRARELKLVEHVIVIERCPHRWWSDEQWTLGHCAPCLKQGFHAREALALEA